MSQDWTALRASVLEKLDIRREFEELGGKITGSDPNESGWLSARSHGRTDRNPSAGINVGNDPQLRGRYKEFNGDGRSMSLFDFAVAIGTFPDFQAAFKYYAAKAGVSIPRGRPVLAPKDRLDFLSLWNSALAQSYCQAKPPCSDEVLKLNGIRFAQYPRKKHDHNVVACPVFDPEYGCDADECGWVITEASGRPLPLFQGKGRDPKPVKVMTVKGSRSGVLGTLGLVMLESASIVVLVEGLSDMLSTQLLMMQAKQTCSKCGQTVCTDCNDGLRPSDARPHAVLATSGGCMENPERYVDLFRRKHVVILFDGDEPGQKGARKWFSEIRKVARTVRQIQLPGGKDIRDFVCVSSENNYQKLLSLGRDDSPCLVAKAVDGTVEIGESTAVERAEEGKTGRAHPKFILQRLRLAIIGEDEEMNVKLYSITHRKTYKVKPSSLTIEQLFEMSPDSNEVINTNPQIDVPGMVKLNQ